jgi:MFS family permease
VITPLALTILASAFPVARRGAIVGIWGGLGGLAVAGGPLVGGAVVQGLDWHWVFWINVPIGALAVLGSLLFLPAGRPAAAAGAGSARARLDGPGAVLIAGGAALLAWGLVRAGGSGWGDGAGLAALAAGALADRIGTRPLIVCGLGLQAAGLAWVSVLASGSASSGYGRYVLPFVIAGVGISMAIPTVPTAVLGAVAPGDVGRASGVSNTMQRFGGAFGIALVSAVFAAHGHLGSAASFTAGYRPAMLVSAGLSLAGALAAAGISRRRTAAPETGVASEAAASSGVPGVLAPGGLKFVP